MTIAAGVVFAVAAVRWNAASERVAQERRELRHVARVEFDLSRADGVKTTEYTPRRPGMYAIALETRGLDWEPRATATFAGAFEVEVVDPGGRSVARKRFQNLYHTNESHPHWIGLDTITIESAGTGAWQVRVATVQPDPNFVRTASALLLNPPARFDTGWAALGNFLELAIASILGLLLLIAGAVAFYVARRKERR
ncbi:MAG TPA: hypothetical protein VNN77_06105 [candidate division Zixibacteria bacterium]|nr:hypothetical protein [candidate division Zixibacteria bacterium]